MLGVKNKDYVDLQISGDVAKSRKQSYSLWELLQSTYKGREFSPCNHSREASTDRGKEKARHGFCQLQSSALLCDADKKNRKTRAERPPGGRRQQHKEQTSKQPNGVTVAQAWCACAA
jgi:hypothetical protein